MAVVKANVNDLLELCRGVIREEELPELLDYIGAPLDEREGDTLFIEVTPDRPDYLSVEGIAYALLSYTGNTPEIEFELEKSGYSVQVEEVKTRPYIAALVARNVRLSEEGVKALMQFQDKIHETFGRKRKKVAVGVHDLKEIHGKKVYYRKGSGKEKFIPLNEEREMSLTEVLTDTEKGVKYAHLIVESTYPMVMDDKGIISFPPILNSDRTKVLVETTDYFVEITGTDQESVENAARIMALIFQMRGGEVKSVEINYPNENRTTPDLTPKSIEFSVGFVNKILGMNFSDEEIASLLKKVSINMGPYSSEAVYPAWRVDIMDETDIAEEVAIAYGYNNFEPEKPELFTIAHAANEFENQLSEILIGMGFREIKTFVLSNPNDEYEKLNLKGGNFVELENPLTTEHTMVRTSLIPSLIRVVAQNKKYQLPIKLYEIGECVDEEGKTIKKLAIGIYGPKVGFEEISGVVARLLERLGKEYMGEKLEGVPYYIEGRAAKIGDSGELGEIHPEVLERFGLEYPLVVFQINFKEL